MKNLVCESIEEVFEAQKMATAKKVQRKVAKQGGEVEKQTIDEKADQAIAALKKKLVLAKKPNALGAKAKAADIKELEDKIKGWEAKKNKK